MIEFFWSILTFPQAAVTGIFTNSTAVVVAVIITAAAAITAAMAATVAFCPSRKIRLSCGRKIKKLFKGRISDYFVLYAQISNPQVYSAFYDAAAEKQISREVYSVILGERGGKGVFKSDGSSYIIVCQFCGKPGSAQSRHSEMQNAAEMLVRAVKNKKFYGKGGSEYYSASLVIGAGADSELFPEIEAYNIISLAKFARIKAGERGQSVLVADNPLRILKREMDSFNSEIEKGLHLDEFTPFFIPLVDAHEMSIVGCEALVRWNKDKYRIIEAAKFKDIAQEKNMFELIDMRVVEKSFSQFSCWKEKGLVRKGFTLWVNLSQNTLLTVPANEFLSLAAEAGLTSAEIQFDLQLDGGLGEEEKNAINALKDSGFGITYDISSFNNISVKAIAEISFNTIKVGCNGLSGAAQCGKQRELYRAIINMAADSGSIVVAKGVESMAGLDFIKKLGITCVQGYYFTRALNHEDFMLYLQKYPHKIA